jgi:hypothetical protein
MIFAAVATVAAALEFGLQPAAAYETPWCTVVSMGTGSVYWDCQYRSSKSATAKAMCWQAIVASAMRARTISPTLPDTRAQRNAARPKADISSCAAHVRFRGQSGHPFAYKNTSNKILVSQIFVKTARAGTDGRRPAMLLLSQSQKLNSNWTGGATWA